MVGPDLRRRGGKLAPYAAPLSIGVGVVAFSRETHFVWASPLLLAFLVGLIFSLAIRQGPARAAIAVTGSTLLRLGVALLGLKVSAADLSAVGPGLIAAGLGLAAFSVVIVIGAARTMGLDRSEAVVVGAGCGVCGASAAAAAAAAAKAQPNVAPWSILALTVLGLAAIPAMNAIAAAAGLTPLELSVWRGLALPEVAHVVIADVDVTSGDASSAMMAKMARVAALGPIIAAIAIWAGGQSGGWRGALKLPLYLWAFLALMALSIAGLIPAPLGAALSLIGAIILAAAMAAIGLAFQRRRPTAAEARLLLANAVGVVIVVALSAAAAVSLF
jgi:uncharacterized integral membrane protein (TIGR00698 family)